MTARRPSFWSRFFGRDSKPRAERTSRVRRAFLEGLEERRVMATQVFTNVPEANNYSLLYELNIADSSNFSSGAVPYAVNNAAAITQPYDRIAYYLELDTDGAGPAPTQWVYASMDQFSTDVTKIGVPNLASGAQHQRTVSNMNVASNVGGIVTGTGISTGNLEFWPINYSGANGIGIPGASGSAFDFGDAVSAGNYGSMQIHNHGAGQTLFAFNRWGGAGGNSDLGIGNRGTGDPDWTFAQNANTYTVKNLAVLVRQTTVPPTPTAPVAPVGLTSRAPELSGYQLLYHKNIPTTAVNFNTAGVGYNVDNSAFVPAGSFDRVAYFMDLGTSWAEVSFDADGFSTDPKRVGVPNTASGAVYKQYEPILKPLRSSTQLWRIEGVRSRRSFEPSSPNESIAGGRG